MEVIDGQLHEPGLDDYWDEQHARTQQMVLSEALRTLIGSVGVNGAVSYAVPEPPALLLLCSGLVLGLAASRSSSHSR